MFRVQVLVDAEVVGDGWHEAEAPPHHLLPSRCGEEAARYRDLLGGILGEVDHPVVEPVHPAPVDVPRHVVGDGLDEDHAPPCEPERLGEQLLRVFAVMENVERDHRVVRLATTADMVVVHLREADATISSPVDGVGDRHLVPFACDSHGDLAAPAPEVEDGSRRNVLADHAEGAISTGDHAGVEVGRCGHGHAERECRLEVVEPVGTGDE